MLLYGRLIGKPIAHNNTPAPMHNDRSTPADNLCSLSGNDYVTPLHELLEDPLWFQYM